MDKGAPKKTMPDLTTQIINDLRRRLRDAQRDLERLQDAIPPLPKAQQLYDRIVAQCLDNYQCTFATSSLENRVRALRISRKPPTDRLHQLELLDLECDHLRLQFLYSRSQLRTLFSLPAILIATNQMSQEFWNTLMRQPQEAERDQPLLMSLRDLEVVIADHIQTLGDLRASLSDLRIKLHHQEEQNVLSFEDDVIKKLANLAILVSESNDIPKNLRHIPDTNGSAEAEDDQVEDRAENELIEQNAAFMEGIQEGEENVNEEPPVLVDDADDEMDEERGM